jgi:hypothetical protein
MRAEWRPALLAVGFLAAACAHNDLGSAVLEADSLGAPGVVLSRALARIQRMGYTVTAVEGERSRFQAQHRGTTLASLLGSDSNCDLDVQAAPALRPNTAHFVITWRARNPGSLAGCRKDAEAILRAATDQERPRGKRPAQPPFGTDKEFGGGPFLGD